MPEKRPILCLDFDGVCHSYTSGWKGADVIPDPPVEGMWEFLMKAREHFHVSVFSSRSHQNGGKHAMAKWFARTLIEWKQWEDTTPNWDRAYSLVAQTIDFPNEKPAAFISIDDRCMLFTGTWPDVNELLAFQPWHQKAADA